MGDRVCVCVCVCVWIQIMRTRPLARIVRQVEIYQVILTCIT